MVMRVPTERADTSACVSTWLAHISPGRSALAAPLNEITTWPISSTLLQALSPTAVTVAESDPIWIDAPGCGDVVEGASSPWCNTDTSASSGGETYANSMTTPPSARSVTSGPTAVTRVFSRTVIQADLSLVFRAQPG